MEEYVATLLFKYNHPLPKKLQLSLFKATPIVYRAKTQFSPDPDNSPPLSAAYIKRIKGIVGALLYYAHAVDNKLLHALRDIGAEQASATYRTNDKIIQLLDYCATYPNYGITDRASNMILPAHSDAAYLNPANPVAALAPTECALKMILTLHTMNLSSPLHKSSNLLRLLLPNPN
eukprot:CCRYP_008148-RA/>CCRYP_008148-RA protein AED:0.30 eAED:0.30 QI:0/-1/0/1/-1/1/1/0/175